MRWLGLCSRETCRVTVSIYRPKLPSCARSQPTNAPPFSALEKPVASALRETDVLEAILSPSNFCHGRLRITAAAQMHEIHKASFAPSLHMALGPHSLQHTRRGRLKVFRYRLHASRPLCAPLCRGRVASTNNSLQPRSGEALLLRWQKLPSSAGISPSHFARRRVRNMIKVLFAWQRSQQRRCLPRRLRSSPVYKDDLK